MSKVKLNEKQLIRASKEMAFANNDTIQKRKNAQRIYKGSKKKATRDAAKKTLEVETVRNREITELENIFLEALKKIKSPAEMEADKRAKAKTAKSESERVKNDIKKLNAAGKKIDVELSELEIKIIIASLRRSESAVKKGKINATGKEYLMRLIKDFEGLIK
jgi:hypothetical protein